MANYNVAGAGDTEWNGLYTPSGTSDGVEAYSLDGTHHLSRFFVDFDTGWALSTSIGGGGVAYVAYSYDDTPPEDGWWEYSGDSPAPSVSVQRPPRPSYPTIANVERTYVSAGDANGVFYFLGTVAGTEAWMNPYDLGAIDIFSNGTFTGTKADVSNREAGVYHTVLSSPASPFITIDLGPDLVLVLKGYNWRNRNDDNANFPTGINTYGSNDNETWDLIDSVTGLPMTLSSWVYRPVTPGETAYRFVRFECIESTGSPAYLTTGEIELYGTLNPGGGLATNTAQMMPLL